MNEEKQQHITSIGGSAIMEGVMMRGPKEIASAVRRPDGEIEVDKRPISSLVTKYHVNKIPILRGVFAFFDSMICSMRSLMWSAEFFDIEDDGSQEPSKLDKWLTEKLGDKLKDYVIYFSVIIAVIFSVGLFFVLPWAVTLMLELITENNFVITLVEGLVRIAIFLGYILLVSRMEEIKRVFQYHGAEHKTIFCYEAGLDLTVENARKMGRLHPRCGTSFLVFVMIISIILFSFIGGSRLTRLCLRLLLLPVVAGISYEIIRWAGRSQNKIVCLLSKPGLALQRITTREPDDSQLEVAIASMKAVLTGNKEDDKW